MTPAPDPWAARLAAVLARDLGHPATAAALQALTADLPAAPPGHDDPARQTRQTILQLLDRRSTQILLPPLSRTAPTPLPAWPASPLQPVPGFHPAGLAGTSLIAASLDLPPDPVALESWLQTGADEVVLILGAPPPDLPPDPRLRLYCVQGDGLTPTEALNLGLRLARHQRCVVLSPGIALPPDFLTLTPALPAEYRVNEGPANGSAFLIDLDRRDLALAGGFNEHLSSTDFALEDLMARLAGLGLRASPVPHSHLTRPAAAPRPDFGSDNLRKTLLRHPDFAALCNRIIAAQMPQWTGQDTRAFGLLAPTPDQPATHPPLLHPTSPPALQPPLHVRTDAEHRARIDLVARHIGGAPVLLSSRRLDIVLNLPANSACALDVAVAGSHDPDIVKFRRAWLLVDIDRAALPRPDSPAMTAFQMLRGMATRHALTLVLRLPPDASPDEVELLADHRTLGANRDPALTRGFLPLTLRELNADPSDWAIPNATLDFTPETVADFADLAAQGPAILLRRPKIFVDAQHGLGNRLRALASAGAIAQATGRELVIIWQADTHCACSFEDLFERGGAVLSEGFAPDATAMGIDLFNYMEVEPGADKDRPVALSAFRDVYLRSAYPLVSPLSTWTTENAWLTGLRPGPVVRDLVASVRPDPSLAVHVRMEGGVAAEHLPYEFPANWTAAAHREIDHWRRRSHFHFFQTRLDQLIDQGLADRVFLASDTQTTYAAFADRYGDRISALPRRVTDRSAEAIVHALADAILLSRAPRLLGSTWSSFTELAARLAPGPVDVELSGRDF